MSGIDDKGWEEIRKVATALDHVGAGGVDLVVPASSIVELFKELQALRDRAPLEGNWYAAADIDRLVRELDVALNGELGAAKSPRLCDVVAQVKGRGWRLVQSRRVPPG